MTLVHINIPRGHYIGQVRRRGARRWRTVTGRRQRSETAMAAAVLAMGEDDKRARVLFIDASGYYEPNVTMECSR